ncbi:MAG TPA: hypothetical protein VFP88_08700 [Rhodanobacteraceae bacterium]|nr:hypothetical protein [Rhodanobacteraceae bacterium]
MNAPSRLLALAVASLFATAAVAQYAPPPPPPPPPPPAQGAIPPPPPPPPAAPVAPTAPAEQQSLPAPPPASDQTYPDQNTSAPATTGGMTNERSVQFQNQQGATVTVNYGMPAPTQYGPKPPFAQLDTSHDGRISQAEAQAYLPLVNDWIHVAHHADSISKAQYQAWND